MCGIVGILSAGSLVASDTQARVGAMAGTLRHRGPDAIGEFVDDRLAFGHCRLSIIDLSDAGRQPMHSDDGRHVIIYNGEVYNYLELRAELERQGLRFHTATDTEVVLAAYRTWGADALSRFNGMWAFAIWDRQLGELFLARDRVGKKPLYYARSEDGSLYFASEIKAFASAGLRLGIDPQAAYDFLTQGTYGHLGGRGFFTGLRQLPAGHWMTVTRERTEIRRYWELPVVARPDRVPYDAAFIRRFRELFYDAVRLRLRSDVPVGATLSGGLDSSAIALVVNDVTGGAPLHLFTAQFPGTGYDESAYFDAVVERLAQPLVHRVPLLRGGWIERVRQVLRHQEEPFGDTSILAHFSLMEAARGAGVPVLLSGQGGDELLLGYPSMVQAYLGSMLARGRLGQAFREARAWSGGRGQSAGDVLRAATMHALPLPLRDRLRAAVLGRRPSIASRGLRDRVTLERFTHDPRRSSLDSYLEQVFSRFALPHLVHYDDRNAMAFSVEGRMPFLDYRLVELMASARYEALFHDGRTKRVLRDSLADRLPPIVLERRDKIGFFTPLAAQLRAAVSEIRAFMTPERVHDLGVLDYAYWSSRLEQLLAGDNTAELDVWRGFIFHLWADAYGVALRHDVVSDIAAA
jgi:asparagine synthase (glutamine-hydrolysing)